MLPGRPRAPGDATTTRDEPRVGLNTAVSAPDLPKCPYIPEDETNREPSNGVELPPSSPIRKPATWITAVGEFVLAAGITSIVLAHAPSTRPWIEGLLTVAILLAIMCWSWPYFTEEMLETKYGRPRSNIGRTAYRASGHLMAIDLGAFAGTGAMSGGLASGFLVAGLIVIAVMWVASRRRA